MDADAVHATPRQSQKITWIITHGASGPRITVDMLRELGQIEADECHSTKDRVMIYTYLHLVKRVRQTSIEKFMMKAQKMHGIVLNEIYGYESIAGNTRNGQDIPIEQHVGFQMLVRHYLTDDEAFMPCTDGEATINRGLIVRAAEVDPDKPPILENQSKARIITYTKKLEVKVEQAKKQEKEMHSLFTTYTRVSDERSNLRVENAMLKRKVQDLEQRLEIQPMGL